MLCIVQTRGPKRCLPKFHLDDRSKVDQEDYGKKTYSITWGKEAVVDGSSCRKLATKNNDSGRPSLSELTMLADTNSRSSSMTMVQLENVINTYTNKYLYL